MIFHFNTFNHCRQGQIIVEDITQIMGQQLFALGHLPIFDNGEFTLFGHNVILESFADDPNTIRRIAEAHGKGCRFLYVATEEPTANGFNHGLEPAMIDRQNAFAEAAKYCDGILHLVPGEHVTRWYSQHAPAAYAELGYAPTLVQSPGEIEPVYDFGFYGKMTWRREQMLAKLMQLSGCKVVRITSLDAQRELRDASMRAAKVIVQIRANEEWGMVSSTRCASALNLGRPVIAEPHDGYAKPWDQVVPFAASIDEFYSDAIALTFDWRAAHADQLRKFAAVLTPEICIGEPLRKIGILK